MPSPSLTLLRTQSDERLVSLARGGHERAFEAIVDRYRKPLLRAARRVLPEGRAEDALQQALLAAWTGLQRGDEVRDLRPWLYRIVHNAALNALRVSGYDYAELHEAVKIADAGDDELERRAVMRQTLASLAALPERQREALIRTAVSGDAQEDVARDLGLSDNALRQLLHRARVKMRSAATALTPLPLVAEAAARGGVSLSLAKAGTVAVLAGGALSPAIVHQVTDRSAPAPATATAQVAPPRHTKQSAAAAEPEHRTATPVRRRAPVVSTPARVRPARPRGASGRGTVRKRSGRRISGSGDPDEAPSSSGPGRGVSDDDVSERSEGPGPSATPEREPDVVESDHSGSGSGESSPEPDAEGPGPAPLAETTPEPDDS